MILNVTPKTVSTNLPLKIVAISATSWCNNCFFSRHKFFFKTVESGVKMR